MYQEARNKDGSVSLLYLKMLAIGPGQVGKSTFLKRLKGQMKWDIDSAPQETHPQCSTGQAEMEQVYVSYSRQTMAVTSSSQWHLFECEREIEELIIAIPLLLAKQKNFCKSVTPQQPIVQENLSSTYHSDSSTELFKVNSTSDQRTALEVAALEVDNPIYTV